MPRVYKCPAGLNTVGYGHVVTKEDNVKADAVLSKEQIDELLVRDVEKYASFVDNSVTVPLTQNQFDALVSFVFNIGTGAFQRSTLRMKLNRGEYEAAAEELLKWTRVNGKVSKGLVKRRQFERDLFLS